MKSVISAALAIAVAATMIVALRSQHEKGRAIPPPAADAASSPTASEIAVFAGGCFWGVQGVYQHIKGVTSAVSGYAGGPGSTALYEMVVTGDTGHAESVEVTFDPRQVSYGQLLQVFFSVAHDPTTLNRQGPDVGTQYRSAIFPKNEEQARVARAYIAQLNAARVFEAPIVTRVESRHAFYRAEAYHQDYMTRHPNDLYIVINDRPKVEDVKRLFPSLYRAEPVLVGRTR
jgi:peptide-methionine (S)-S-oxide reductase